MKKTTTLLLSLCIITALSSTAQEVKINNNYVIEADGTPRLENDATVWDDMNVYPDATTKSGTNSPTYVKFSDNGSSQGIFLWTFSNSTEQEVYFAVQFPHSYKEGTTLYPHVHWTTTSGTPTRTNVVWGLEYNVMSIGGTYPSTSTIITGNTITSGITSIAGVRQHLITPLDPISGTGLGISTILTGRLFRATANSNDTFGSPVCLLSFDLHYEKDTEGSREEFNK